MWGTGCGVQGEAGISGRGTACPLLHSPALWGSLFFLELSYNKSNPEFVKSLNTLLQKIAQILTNKYLLRNFRTPKGTDESDFQFLVQHVKIRTSSAPSSQQEKPNKLQLDGSSQVPW